MWEREIGGARSEVGNKYVVIDANADAPMKFVPKEKEGEHGRLHSAIEGRYGIKE